MADLRGAIYMILMIGIITGSHSWRGKAALFVVMDNLYELHEHPRFLALRKKLRIHRAWTPTEASCLT